MTEINQSPNDKIKSEHWERGVNFEKYVKSLLDPKDFSIILWTKDRSRKDDGTPCEADYYPDYTIRYIPTNKKFSIECKYRSRLQENKMLSWTYPKRLEQYYEIAERDNLPLFIIIGVGGLPDSPSRMFRIPLEDIKNQCVLSPEFYTKYERKPKDKFEWKFGTLQ